MANYTNRLPGEEFDKLHANLQKVVMRVEVKELPQYPTFVNNLMKGFDSPNDEFLHPCVGMSGESGELLDAAKKVWAYGKDINHPNVIEEMGDLRFYYQAMLNYYGISDEHIVAANMTKLDARYKSGKYSNEQAIARADKAPGADRKFFGQQVTNVDPPAAPVDTTEQARIDAMNRRISETNAAAEEASK